MSRVVYVEDEPDVAALVTFTLELEDLDVEVIPDGRRVVELLHEKGAPDVLILDLMLPGISGLDILAEVRSDPKLADLPVLVLSACARESERQTMRQHGASAFLAKPFDTDELARLVRKLLSETGLPS